MDHELPLPERRQAILKALEQSGKLSVSELSQRFHVSEVTIRQDLEALHKQKHLLRTRGGAALMKHLPEFSIEFRERIHTDEKKRIACAAARLVQPGDSLLLDASTTTQALLPYLQKIPNLTVITNSLKIAIGLVQAPQVHVVMPGGTLRADSFSLVGLANEDLFQRLHVNLGFFGARGITPDNGLMEVNLDEARFKRKMVKMCQKAIALVDASKWGQVAVMTFASLEEIHCVYTDAEAPIKMVDKVRRRGVEVQIVD